MDINERDRLAGALAALRPDWAGPASTGKALRTWLTNHAMEWTYRDALIRMALCAIEPTTVTPARALTDGPWLTVLRYATGATTETPPTRDELGPTCAICGEYRSLHRGARILSDDIGPHEWIAAPAWTPGTPRGFAWAQEHASGSDRAGQRLPSANGTGQDHSDGHADVQPLASAFHQSEGDE